MFTYLLRNLYDFREHILYLKIQGNIIFNFKDYKRSIDTYNKVYIQLIKYEKCKTYNKIFYNDKFMQTNQSRKLFQWELDVLHNIKIDIINNIAVCYSKLNDNKSVIN